MRVRVSVSVRVRAQVRVSVRVLVRLSVRVLVSVIARVGVSVCGGLSNKGCFGAGVRASGGTRTGVCSLAETSRSFRVRNRTTMGITGGRRARFIGSMSAFTDTIGRIGVGTITASLVGLSRCARGQRCRAV